MPTPGRRPAKLPEMFFVRYEPRRFLVAAAALSPRAELAHRRLCDLYWSTGKFALSTPASIAELGRMCQSKVPVVLAELARIGWRVRKGRLVNAEVREILAKARNVYAGHVRAGKCAHVRPESERSLSGAEAELELSTSAAPTMPEQLRVKSKKVQDITLNAERSACNAQEGAGEEPGEREFMEELATLFPDRPKAFARERENWGGWWRNRYRENPGRARSVLADIRCGVREGRIVKSPGAAAQDLWKRLP